MVITSKILCRGVRKFLGDFRVYLGGNSFLKGLVILGEIRNFEDLIKFYNNNLKLKISRWTPRQSPTTWGALAWWSADLWCFKTNFLSFIPSLNLIGLYNFTSTPALRAASHGLKYGNKTPKQAKAINLLNCSTLNSREALTDISSLNRAQNSLFSSF